MESSNLIKDMKNILSHYEKVGDDTTHYVDKLKHHIERVEHYIQQLKECYNESEEIEESDSDCDTVESDESFYGRIYFLSSDKTSKCYVGSTEHTLKTRLAGHRNNYKQWKCNKPRSYCSSYEIVKYDDVMIKSLYEGRFKSRREMYKLEGQYIESMDNTVNKIKPIGRVNKKYDRLQYYLVGRLDENTSQLIASTLSQLKKSMTPDEMDDVIDSIEVNEHHKNILGLQSKCGKAYYEIKSVCEAIGICIKKNLKNKKVKGRVIKECTGYDCIMDYDIYNKACNDIEESSDVMIVERLKLINPLL